MSLRDRQNIKIPTWQMIFQFVELAHKTIDIQVPYIIFVLNKIVNTIATIDPDKCLIIEIEAAYSQGL